MHTPDLHPSVDHLTDRLATSVDGLRERLADTISTEDRAAWRELDRVGKRVEHASERTDYAVDELAERLGGRLEALTEVVAEDRKRGWFSRLVWIALGLGAGAAAWSLLDPKVGRARREAVGERVVDATTHATDVAKGAVIEAVADVLSDDAEAIALDAGASEATIDVTPAALRQRVKAEALTPIDGALGVVVVAKRGGLVTLKGLFDPPATEDEIIAAVEAVAGVAEVDSEMREATQRAS